MAARFCVVLAILLAACSSITSGTGSQPTHAATAATSASSVAAPPSGSLNSPDAIFVSWLAAPAPQNYTVSLVTVEGKMRASAAARNRRYTCNPLVPLPNVSASHSRLYFLDGDATLKYLKPTGESGTVRDLAVGPNQEAVFAVSPDDSRLAVAVLDHLQYPVTTRLYVEDLASGTNHLELFSGTVLEWPVAWYHGNLLLAVGINAPPQNCTDSFSYASLGYHVADPNTGNRIRSVCDGWTSYSSPVPAGTLCINGAVALGQAPSKVESWDGATRILRNVGGCPQNGVLSPDGNWIASNEVTAGSGCTGQATIYLLATDGRIVQTPAVGVAEGWIDSGHLVVGGDGESAPASIFDVSARTTKQVGALGFFAGTLPNDFSSTS